MGKVKCSAYNCENRTKAGMKFVRFPLKDPKRLKKWLVNLRWKGWTPSRFSVLCLSHFEPKYIIGGDIRARIRANAVPTIFNFSGSMKKKKVVLSQKSKQAVSSIVEIPTQSSPAQPAKSDKSKTPKRYSDEGGTWVTLMDDSIQTIESFPGFFHGDYCLPHSIRWAGVNSSHVETENKELQNDLLLKHIIEVKGPWEWLGLDIRGPMPTTLNGSEYILTVTDYYSKWLEAFPLRVNTSVEVASHIVDIISHFGFPYKILSRLTRKFIKKINDALKKQLKGLCEPLVVFHRQTGILDLEMQDVIDRMVTDLLKEHGHNWDVFLPAKVFSLCFQEHSTTKERPLSLLHCKRLQPNTVPRHVPFCVAEIRESIFVIQFNQKQDTDVHGIAGKECEKEISESNTLMRVAFIVQQ
ncbi:uncharacterized protein zgc:153292 [Osmerus mordax]|uniref:uncharacterized protein zgc:153292 n=1 Tax=Osmerus mordax TaxID=8014 RepID=UPI00350EED81